MRNFFGESVCFKCGLTGREDRVKVYHDSAQFVADLDRRVSLLSKALKINFPFGEWRFDDGIIRILKHSVLRPEQGFAVLDEEVSFYARREWKRVLTQQLEKPVDDGQLASEVIYALA